jgi:hypothetical protein
MIPGPSVSSKLPTATRRNGPLSVISKSDIGPLQHQHSLLAISSATSPLFAASNSRTPSPSTQCTDSVAAAHWRRPLPRPRCGFSRSQTRRARWGLELLNLKLTPSPTPGFPLRQTPEHRATTKESPEHPRVPFGRPPAPGERTARALASAPDRKKKKRNTR